MEVLQSRLRSRHYACRLVGNDAASLSGVLLDMLGIGLAVLMAVPSQLAADDRTFNGGYTSMLAPIEMSYIAASDMTSSTTASEKLFLDVSDVPALSYKLAEFFVPKP